MAVADPDRQETAIVRFYRGTGRDARGRTLEEILAWDDDRLEAIHDYIQWLFPLDEPSAFNPAAPLVSEADQVAFREDSRLATNLRRALDRMLAFYGFTLESDAAGARVVRSREWAEKSEGWLYPGSHNLLRLTRILKSLTLLSQPGPARAFYDALRAHASARVTEETLTYWHDAVRAKGRSQ
jgi:hypothetical protein